MAVPEADLAAEAALEVVVDLVVDLAAVEVPVADLVPVVDLVEALAVAEVDPVEVSEAVVEDAAVSRLFACLFSPCTITLLRL